MNKITADHLLRAAYVYVRQSTTDQLAHNPESRRRQYALKERAEALGWQNVVVIDDDLGRSGGGIARKGFERLLVAIGNGSAGASIKGTRRAHNPTPNLCREVSRARLQAQPQKKLVEDIP